jgi:hypothetical protein
LKLSLSKWRWALLLFELFLFALILILPQVDLPDFAFQRGSAPIVAKAAVSSPPMLATVSRIVQIPLPLSVSEHQRRTVRPLDPSTPLSSLSLLCRWLC